MKKVESTADFAETADGVKVYNVSKSRLVSLINWVHVFGTYLPLLWFLVVGVIIFQILSVLFELRFDIEKFWSNEINYFVVQRPVALDLGWKSMVLLALLIWYVNHREKPVYLIDFACFQPPESWRLSPEQLMDIMRFQGCFTEDSIQFLTKLLERSGCGPKTAWPPSIIKCLDGKPADRSIDGAREESQIVIYDCVNKVLKNTGVNPKEIDILIINCSLFSPTPSLCSMVINEFNMRSDISSYNLSGMGCSAGIISIELAKNLLAARPNSTALIVSTENLTQNLYLGNDRAFLVQNTLFRCGGAAIILSNRWMDGHRAMFKLLHTVRTQFINKAEDCDSFGCVFETEDELHNRGVRLSKDIVKVAGRAMEQNFTTLGPYVLPVSEQITTGFWMLARFLSKKFNMGKVNPYIPDFKRGIDHFCIHAGGRGVIDGIQKNLKLTDEHVAASRHALYTYGNTSSSSIWYEMDYVRTKSKLRSGQRVLQVAFGSGFKCNTAVWLCINNKKTTDEKVKSD